MKAKHIESMFAAMGARLKVREIASRWHMGIRKWIDPRYNTLVLGVPGFVPLKNGNAGSPATDTEENGTS